MEIKLVLFVLSVVLGAGLIHAFRNRLLAFALEHIRAVLRARIGEGFELVGARLDDRWRLELEGARVPLPRGVLLDIHHARISGLSRLLLASWRDALELIDLEGAVGHVPSGGAIRSVTVPIAFEQDGGAGGPVHGKLSVREVTLTLRAGATDPVPSRPWPHVSLDGHLEIGFEGWSFEKVRGSWADSPIEGRIGGRLPVPPTGPFETLDLSVGFVDVGRLSILLALLDLPEQAPIPFPADLSLDVHVTAGAAETDALGRPFGVRCRATTASTELTLDGTIGADLGFREMRLTGRLSSADALCTGLLPTAVVSDPLIHMVLDTKVEGGLGEPILSGTTYAPLLRVALGPLETHPAFELQDVMARIRLSGRQFGWGLSAQALGGRLAGSGSADLSNGVQAHTSTVSWEGIRVEQVPTGPGGRHGLVPHVRALAEGEMTFTGTGRDTLVTRGQGTLVLDHVEYLFLRKIEPALASYGLPLPPLTGAGPCRCRVALSSGWFTFSSITGKLDGMSYTGEIACSFDGEVKGSLMVELERPYLARSHLLSFPASLTDSVTVPTYVTGRIDNPSTRIDLAGALGKVLGGGKLGNSVAGALGSLWKAVSGDEEKPAPNLDHVFERILAGSPDSNRLLDELADSGLTEAQVESLLDDYQRRRRSRRG